MEEKCSISCTEDSNPEELLLVTLPPNPPAVEDRVPKFEFEEQNNAVYVPDVVVDQEKVVDNTASQAKEKILPRRSSRLLLHLWNFYTKYFLKRDEMYFYFSDILM